MIPLNSIPAMTQETGASLQLIVERDFGFSIGGRIQGKFTLEVAGPQNLTQMEFLIEDSSFES